VVVDMNELAKVLQVDLEMVVVPVDMFGIFRKRQGEANVPVPITVAQ